MSSQSTILTTATILLTLALPLALTAQQNPFVPQLPFGTLVVEYEHRGMTSGTSTLYWNGTDMAEVKEIADRGQPYRSRTVTTLDSIFMIVSEAGQSYVVALPNPAAESARRFDALSSAAQERFRANAANIGTDAGRLLLALLEYPFFGRGTFDPEPRGTPRVAGEACEVARFGMVEVCSMPEAPIVMLRTPWKQEWMCMDEKTATQVQRGASIPAEVFGVPADAERLTWRPEEWDIKVGAAAADREVPRMEVHSRIFDAILEGRILEAAAADLGGKTLDDYMRATHEERERDRALLAGIEAEIGETSEADRERLRGLMCHEDIPEWLKG